LLLWVVLRYSLLTAGALQGQHALGAPLLPPAGLRKTNRAVSSRTLRIVSWFVANMVRNCPILLLKLSLVFCWGVYGAGFEFSLWGDWVVCIVSVCAWMMSMSKRNERARAPDAETRTLNDKHHHHWLMNLCLWICVCVLGA